MSKKLGFIDLRKEIELLAGATGFSWVALRSIDLSKPTTEAKKSLPSNYDQSNINFKNIVSNYYFIDKLVKGYRYMAQPGFDYQSQIGTINTKTQVYIIAHDKKPKNTDYILELDLDEETGQPKQPFRIARVFNIQDAQPMRGGQPRTITGGIEFWRCYTEEDNLGYGLNIT